MGRVLIAGAGISGLALAHELRVRGVEALVPEAGGRWGGKIQSRSFDGFLCEDGPASFLDRHGRVSALARALGIQDQIVPATAAASRRLVVFRGELHEAPISPRAFLRSRSLTPGAKLRVFADLFLPRGPTGHGADESVSAFARRRFGAQAAERLVYPLVSGIYAGDPEQLSLPASFPALAEWERDHRSVILGAARSRGRVGSNGAGAALASFQGGMAELTDALAQEAGARLSLGTTVRRLTHDGTTFRLALEEDGQISEARTDAVVLALPAYAAAATLAGLDPALSDALREVPYVPVALVQLGYAMSALSAPVDAYGFLAPASEGRRVLGAVFASAVFPRSTPAGYAQFSVRVGGARQSELCRLPDDELISLAQGEIGALLGVLDPPTMTRVVRHERALPQYTLGHRERLAVIDAAEARHPGLFLHGNAYRGLGVPDCVRTSVLLAERLAASLGRVSGR